MIGTVTIAIAVLHTLAAIVNPLDDSSDWRRPKPATLRFKSAAAVVTMPLAA